MDFSLLFFTFAMSKIFFSGLQKLFCYSPLENLVNIGCVASAHKNCFIWNNFLQSCSQPPVLSQNRKDIQNIDTGSKGSLTLHFCVCRFLQFQLLPMSLASGHHIWFLAPDLCSWLVPLQQGFWKVVDCQAWILEFGCTYSVFRACSSDQFICSAHSLVQLKLGVWIIYSFSIFFI